MMHIDWWAFRYAVENGALHVFLTLWAWGIIAMVIAAGIDAAYTRNDKHKLKYLIFGLLSLILTIGLLAWRL